jgi:hypothetical protein
MIPEPLATAPTLGTVREQNIQVGEFLSNDQYTPLHARVGVKVAWLASWMVQV